MRSGFASFFLTSALKQGWNFTEICGCRRFVAATSTFIVSTCKLLLQHYLARLDFSPPDACWKSMTFHVACLDTERKGFEFWFHFIFVRQRFTPDCHQTPAFPTHPLWISFTLPFRPSTTLAAVNGLKNDYMFAEMLGRSDENCEIAFSRCTYSLMNVFSQIYWSTCIIGLQ